MKTAEEKLKERFDRYYGENCMHYKKAAELQKEIKEFIDAGCPNRKEQMFRHYIIAHHELKKQFQALYEAAFSAFEDYSNCDSTQHVSMDKLDQVLEQTQKVLGE